VTQARTETDTTEKQEGWRAKVKGKLPFLGSEVDTHSLKIDRYTDEVVRWPKIQSIFHELYTETSSHYELQANRQEDNKDSTDIS
jgi:hypothetical protein